MTQQVAWTPLQLSTPYRFYAFGGTLIGGLLHKSGLPSGPLAETWEVSDYGPPEDSAKVRSGPLKGHTLRQLVQQYPAKLVGPGFSGPHFPLLAKFLDASHPLPVHLHANDDTARLKYAQPNGKSEAWHILWAEPGATVLAGVKPGVSRETLRLALHEQHYDEVMNRHSIQAGDTVYIPGGVLHAFGPGTLVYEIQQTSDLGVSAMPDDLYGQPLPQSVWEANIEALLEEIVLEPQPQPTPGLVLPAAGATRRVCALGPYFALERLSVQGEYAWKFETAQLVSTLENPLTLRTPGGELSLGPAQTAVVPAALQEAALVGEGDALLAYVPDVSQMVAELLQGGHPAAAIRALGAVTL